MGYWKGKGINGTGEFKKRGVKDLKRFCGWEKLEKLYLSCPSNRERLLVLSLLKTGGRINEVLKLNEDMFDISNTFIRVSGMPVSKSRIKNNVRFFSIRRDEPLSEEFANLLFKLKSDEDLFNYKYNTAYNMISKLQYSERWKRGPWYPHRFRGERASQLVRDYNFDVIKLMKYFKWVRPETPIRYAAMNVKELEKAMSGEVDWWRK